MPTTQGSKMRIDFLIDKAVDESEVFTRHSQFEEVVQRKPHTFPITEILGSFPSSPISPRNQLDSPSMRTVAWDSRPKNATALPSSIARLAQCDGERIFSSRAEPRLLQHGDLQEHRQIQPENPHNPSPQYNINQSQSSERFPSTWVANEHSFKDHFSEYDGTISVCGVDSKQTQHQVPNRTRMPVDRLRHERRLGKTHVCFCGRAFNKREHLKRHNLLVHQEVRPFECNVCELHFGTKQNHQVHLSTKKHRQRVAFKRARSSESHRLGTEETESANLTC